MGNKKWLRGIFFAISLFVAIMQTNILSAAVSDQEALGACGTACGSFVFIVIAILVLNIALLVWVAKDSKNRGMGSSVGWIFLVLFTGIIGLIIYLFSRPKGDLVICDVCNNKKFSVARVCPHCGNPSRSIESKAMAVSREQCSGCGHKLSIDAMYCEECGERIKK
jgi:hypothetical protein